MEVPKVDSLAGNGLVNNSTPLNEKDVPVRQIVTAVHEINKSEIMGEGRQLTFARDPQTRKQVIQIVDQSTGEVLDQMPPETLLRLSEQLK